MSCTASQPMLQEAHLLVERAGDVLGQRHAVAVVLVVEDHALLGRTEEGDLERAVGGELHGVATPSKIGRTHSILSLTVPL